jgi:hypothetical protein
MTEPSAHGTLNRYNHYNCRCNLCRARKAEDRRERIARRRADQVADKILATRVVKDARIVDVGVTAHPLPSFKFTITPPDPFTELCAAYHEVDDALTSLYTAYPELEPA